MQISESLAKALGSRREDYNQRFLQVRRQRPELDGPQVLDFLTQGVDPLVRAMASQLDADRLDALVSVAFDATLELGSQRLIGAASAHPCILRAWRQLLPAALSRWPHWSPATAIAAVSNVLFHLGSAEGARPAQWLERMAAALPHTPDPTTWLAAGQVAAWLGGLAQYREPALAQLMGLPTTVAQQLLGLRPDQPLGAVLTRLQEDPWCDPAVARGNAPALRVARQIGAFRGFGGLFEQPPLLAARGEQLFVRSGEQCWLLFADAFGHHLARVARSEFDQAGRGQQLPPGLKLKGERLEEGSALLELSGLGGVTSTAITGATLALSFAASHVIRLVPLT